MKNKFHPNYTINPNETIQEMLDGSMLSDADRKNILCILENRMPISLCVAEYLSQTLGGTISFWSNLDKGYQKGLKRSPKKDLNIIFDRRSHSKWRRLGGLVFRLKRKLFKAYKVKESI